ncbi:peptidoglycan DD-metalloendopeptidase family protein [Paraburkholderia sp. Tr-20389]|uniref:murein hydrolase activator EnvC family protein n=1 Tax=Paraburkholderia sp. Tr-20389 TaxID=2703903 RepID=UPI00198119D6|nr:peptidoglycan DD-metalloendopeptidase family protein [Paraburkholderia sp. Tr-20389]MBN3753248.1 peptidoglycan DD-metalloendopeptidase family protein [Paraburkholderia sp. Tr-20389]
MNQKDSIRKPTLRLTRRECLAAAVVVSAVLLGGCGAFHGPQSVAVTNTSGSAAIPPAPAGYYRANVGDTVSSVASGFSRAPSLIAQWNGISVDSTLVPGELLRVAPVADSENVRPVPDCQGSHVAGRTETPEFLWPVVGAVTTAYGTNGAKGIVISGHSGDPVRAARGGRVLYAGNQVKAYGQLIVIRHDSHTLTAYGNNSRVLVKEGALVTQGQVIAEIGDEVVGKPALIFEVRKDRVPVDPATYLPPCHPSM